MLKRVDVPLDKLRFVRGTSYQLKENYTLDMYRISALTTTSHTQHAGAEVVKQSGNPYMSNLLYPILQALDEEYLGVDMQFGGIDQRKIFMFAREWLPRLGYKKRSYIMNPMIPGLGKSGKMSSSEPGSKLELHDSPEVISKKIKGAFSEDGKVEGNGMLALLQFVLFRFLEAHNRPFLCNGKEYTAYAAVQKDFEGKELTSKPLKEAVATLLTEFLEPLRRFHAENLALFEAAYPAIAAADASSQEGEAGGAAAAASPGLAKLKLALGRVLSVAEHPTSSKHKVVELDCGSEGKRTAVPSDWQVPELKQGAILAALVNCPAHEVQGHKATAELLVVSLFDKETKTNHVHMLEAAAGGQEGPVSFGAADAPEAEVTLSNAKKLLKSLQTKGGQLTVGEGLFPSKPAITAAIEGQLKI